MSKRTFWISFFRRLKRFSMASKEFHRHLLSAITCSSFSWMIFTYFCKASFFTGLLQNILTIFQTLVIKGLNESEKSWGSSVESSSSASSSFSSSQESSFGPAWVSILGWSLYKMSQTLRWFPWDNLMLNFHESAHLLLSKDDPGQILSRFYTRSLSSLFKGWMKIPRLAEWCITCF